VIVLRGVNRKKIRIVDPHRLAWRYAVEAIDEHGGDGPILIVADRHEATEERYATTSATTSRATPEGGSRERSRSCSQTSRSCTRTRTRCSKPLTLSRIYTGGASISR